MRVYALTCALILLLALAGCESAPQPGAPVTQKTACDAANNDKRVALEGYPRLYDMMTMVSDDFSVDLYEQPGGKGDSVTVYLKIGTGANQAEALPDNYTDADLKIHTNTNQIVSTDSRIRVHGTLSVTDTGDSTVCFIMYIDLIEAAPA